MEPNNLKLTDEGESLEYSDPISQGVAMAASASQPTETNQSEPRLSVLRFNKAALIVATVAIVVIGLIASGTFWLLSRTASDDSQSTQSSQGKANDFSVGDLAVDDVEATEQLKVGTAESLAINGQLQVSNSLVLAPMNTPSKPTAGQIYFDSATKQPYYYNGTQFVSLTAGNTGVTILQGNTGAINLVAGTGVAINGLNITNTGVTAITGANGLSVSQPTGNVTLSLPQDLSTAGTPSFAGLSVTNSLAVGKATASQTLDVNGSIGFSGNLVGNSFVPQAGVTYSFATAAAGSYNICTTAANCVGIGGGVTTPGGTPNRLAKFTGAQTVGDSLIGDDGSTVTVNGNLTATGTTLFQRTSDSVTAFQIQNAAGTSNLFNADTVNGRIGILTAGPNYPLDVDGDINTGGSYRINGVQICVASGCVPAAGSSSYIQNGTVTQSANFNIQSAAANQVGAVIQGAVGQTSDLLQVKNSGGTNLVAISSSGTITLSADTNLYRSGANTLRTDDAFQAATLTVTDGTGTFVSDSSGTAIAKDSVAALRVYDTGGSNITFDVNTINNMVGIGTTAATSLLTVGTDTTVASGGITFGTDTNLYRNGDDYLKTDGSFESQALVVNGHAEFNTISANGAASFQNATDSTNAFQIQNAAGTTTLLRADTTNGVIKVGTTGSATQAGTALFVTAAEFSGAIRIGDGTNRIQVDGSTKKMQYVGTARQDVRLTINPEYPGAVLTPDGSGNTGTMTSDFCSGSSRLNINPSVCGANEEFNYYSWIGSGGTMDYDIYVRWQVPSNFSAFQDASAIKMYGWRGTASEKVELAMFQSNGTQCGSTTEINSSNTTWQQTNLSGDETGCSVSANDVVTFRIRLTASASGYARASNLQINYLSQF